ncbi:ribosome biogenesis GTPase YlqF [Mycoplasma sp. M5725]|uniref:Ribosome biogenesis GTPase A n=1 Tax=Mycoplasma phocimorsus TaxID=3045839 RepID=A0AAJ1PQU1_9MOLU|nr:ribosome biogenesis GTPase YlqF [Mycoplasma phocimorsus]MDJ1645649.1 ribosome biogenesis GTPase YlqF [Mycoplasma phocimorsus]
MATKINWFPGHMQKTTREIKEIASLCDVIVYVLDARAPLITFNEELLELFNNKEIVYILSKKDLRDANKDKEVLSKFNNQNLLFTNLKNHNEKKNIIKIIKKITFEKEKRMKAKGLIKYNPKLFVIGMPNVGKSTLINLLLGKRKLKVENYPGVTRKIHWVSIDNFHLLDTPGIMSKRLEEDRDGYILSLMQILKAGIVSEKELFYNVIILLSNEYPEIVDKINFALSIDEIDVEKNLENYCQNNKLTLNQAISKLLTIIRQQLMTFL